MVVIFAKLGVEQINPDAATFLVLAGLATARCTSVAPRARRHPMRHQLALSP
jgi:uncharacterized membrane protein